MQKLKTPTNCSGNSDDIHLALAGVAKKLDCGKHATTLQPDKFSNIDFICHAFRSISADATPWVTGFPGDPNAINHAMWGGRGALPLPRFICSSNNNFIAVSSFNRGDDGRHHRRKQDFAAMHVVMVDDVGTKIARDKVVLPPSALVETSPDNFQAWYFLTEPERDRLKAEALIKGMIASGLTADGSDPGMNGVTRYGRLPVGVNGKAKYVEKLGGPFVQRVAAWSPELRYSIDEIADAYGVDMTMPAKRCTTGGVRSGKAIIPGSTDNHLTLLDNAGLYIEPVSSLEGGHHVICPWVNEHTDQEPSGTIYFEPGDQNNSSGGFKCHHGHCQARTIADLNHFLIRLLELNAGASA
jgi:hypothetical protein